MGDRPRVLTGFSFFYHHVGEGRYADMHTSPKEDHYRTYGLLALRRGMGYAARFIFHARADSWLDAYRVELERLRGTP